MTQRFIPFDGITNFRDAGGYPTRSGQALKWGMVFRSAHLSDASPADLKKFMALGIGEIHDFRRHEERKRYPTPAFESVSTTLYNLRMGSAQGLFDRIEAGTATQTATHQMMVDGYTRYITDHAADFATLLRALSRRHDHGVLLHCTAGKDRTGIGIALLMLTLGVHRNVVLEDYLLSVQGYPAEEIIEILERFLAARGFKSWNRSALVPYCTVHADYLIAALDEIDRLGGIDSYRQEHLKLSDGDVKNLKSRFLEP